MSRFSTAIVLIAAVSLIAGCTQKAPEQTLDDAFAEFRSAYREVETAEEKTALAEGFLSRFPESEYSGGLAGTVAYYRGEEMEDPEGAYQIVQSTLVQIEDPEIRFQVETELYPLAHEIGQPMDLDELVAGLAAHRDLSYSEHTDVIDLARDHEQWMSAEQHAAAALVLATPEAFLGDHPDDEFTDEEVQAKVDARRLTALSEQGWAMAQQDRAAEADAIFETAADLSTVNYLGVPKGELYSYWGRTALALGDSDRALELLGPTAVLGDDDAALAAYREAYVAKHESEEGFEEHLWSERENLAKTIDDFTLPDYEGNPVQLASFEGKVILLSFWFPT